MRMLCVQSFASGNQVLIMVFSCKTDCLLGMIFLRYPLHIFAEKARDGTREWRCRAHHRYIESWTVAAHGASLATAKRNINAIRDRKFSRVVKNMWVKHPEEGQFYLITLNS